jgi:chromate transporter
VLLRLASVMGLISVLSFGGANAVLPQLHSDVVDKQHWLTSPEFARFWALGQMVPGPTLTIGALIGYAVAGLVGAAVASFALFVPAGVIAYALGSAWERFHEHPWRDRLAAGFAPVVLGLIWAGCATLLRGGVDGIPTAVIALAAGALIVRTRVNRVAIILAAGVVGFVWLR